MADSSQRADGVPLTTSSSKPSPASTDSSTPSIPTNLDKSYYTWSTAFSILMSRMTGERDIPLEQKYFKVHDVVKADAFCKRCESNRDHLLQYSPVVSFLKNEVGKLGGDLNSSNIKCKVCTAEQSGGFSLDHGILLCANKFRNRGHQEDTMAHEMVHAWDHLRYKVDHDNLKHQACLEIRASTLSGECRFTREFFTKNQWKISEQLQRCVRRRATLSLMARDGVKNDIQASKLVNEVWDSCFYDTKPFDEVYR